MATFARKNQIDTMKHLLVFALCALLLGMSNCSSDPVEIPDEPNQEEPSGGEEPDEPNQEEPDDPGEEPDTPPVEKDYGTCEQDANAPIGFACIKKVPTGGTGGDYRTVTTASELTSALTSPEALTIYIKGVIEVSQMMKVQAKNKTILGLPGSALTNPNRTKSGSGILYFRDGSDNLILRNVTFKSAGAYDVDGNDNLCIDGTTNIWVDHCDFQDGVDGNFDAKNASDNIAVTWCKFHYLLEPQAGGSGGSDDHRFTNLWGGSDNHTQDRGHLRTTFQYCWWGEGCRERMPRVRYGQIHLVNCLYDSSVANYCIGVGLEANILVEESVFIGMKKPYECKSDKDTGVINFTGCTFTKTTPKDIGQAFTTPYSLDKLSPAEDVETLVSRYAGATLTIAERL